MRHVIPCLLCTVYTFPDVSPCRHYSPGTYHKNTTTTAARLPGVAVPALFRVVHGTYYTMPGRFMAALAV